MRLAALALLLCGCAATGLAVELDTLSALAFRNGFPLVGMAGWRDGYLKAGGGMNHFAHRRDLISVSAQEAYQNSDTLYSNAWVDLASGPVTLQVPATGSRYVALQFVSSWTDTFALLTRRELGGRAATLVLTPPGWNGTLPAGARRVSCPTTLVAVWLRLFVAGEGDLASVRALQDQFVFAPAAAAPAAVSADFLTALGSLLIANPPPAALRAAFASFAPLGLSLAQGYNAAQLSRADREVANAAIARSRRALTPPTRQPRRLEAGWAVYDAGEAIPATLEERIFRAQGGPGAFAALPRRESVYLLGYADSNGEPLRGDQSYEITLDAGSTPPVDGFWSISVYNAQGKPFGNARHSIHSQTAGLRRGSDGSLHITLAPELALAEQSNWLPVWRGESLRVVLRLYGPRAAVLDGSWHPPLIVPVNQ
jgi:hypothetical protein